MTLECVLKEFDDVSAQCSNINIANVLESIDCKSKCHFKPKKSELDNGNQALLEKLLVLEKSIGDRMEDGSLL